MRDPVVVRSPARRDERADRARDRGAGRRALAGGEPPGAVESGGDAQVVTQDVEHVQVVVPAELVLVEAREAEVDALQVDEHEPDAGHDDLILGDVPGRRARNRYSSAHAG